MKPKIGPKAAAELLAGLNPVERKKLYEKMLEMDPETAVLIKENMIGLEDITKLSVKMLQEFMREISIDQLALALRAGSTNVRKFVLENVSKSMRSDIEDVLNGPPRPVEEVQKCEKKVVAILRKMIDEGKLVLIEDGDVLV